MRTFPTIFIVPTGIGCEIGGFAGDAIPAAKLLAASTGCLITHPNVMNGGSLSTVDERIFYVEGYSLDKFARGEIGLKKVYQQRIGIIFDSGISNEMFHRHATTTAKAPGAQPHAAGHPPRRWPQKNF